MFGLDNLDTLFVLWAFTFQIVLIIHFAVRKQFYKSYTEKYGWLVYALSIPAAVISMVILFGGKSFSFWFGGFLFLIYATYGYQIDYIKKILWRKPLVKSIMFPYVTLYLATVMFYWWPMGILNRTLWFVYAVLFVLATYLNITSH